jgi:hypothetical protein
MCFNDNQRIVRSTPVSGARWHDSAWPRSRPMGQAMARLEWCRLRMGRPGRRKRLGGQWLGLARRERICHSALCFGAQLQPPRHGVLTDANPHRLDVRREGTEGTGIASETKVLLGPFRPARCEHPLRAHADGKSTAMRFAHVVLSVTAPPPGGPLAGTL